jgi:hypothetical protein
VSASSGQSRPGLKLLEGKQRRCGVEVSRVW